MPSPGRDEAVPLAAVQSEGVIAVPQGFEVVGNIEVHVSGCNRNAFGRGADGHDCLRVIVIMERHSPYSGNAEYEN